jgi:SET domain-containing protein
MILEHLIIKNCPILGYGVYAKKKIPKGSIVITECIHCSKISPKLAEEEVRRDFILSHAPISKRSKPDFILPCDKRIYYLNHSCNANILNAGLGFDLAVREIQAGEEVTFDYRSMYDDNIQFKCQCQAENCQGYIRCLHPISPALKAFWMEKIMSAWPYVSTVPQPLLSQEYFSLPLKINLAN